MPSQYPTNPADNDKSREQLMREINELRSQLVDLSEKINLVKSREPPQNNSLKHNNLQARKLANAIEMAHLGPWEYDVINDTFYFNDHFYKIFRTTSAQVGGYTMTSAEYARRFVHPDEIHIVGEEIRKSNNTTDPNYSRQLEHRILYADGTVGYITVRIFIQKDAQGKTVRTLGVNQDITERKKAEEALRQLNEILAQRTALAEARAKQLQALAAELTEAEERERRRMAELLHEDLQQIMAAARYQLESVCERLPSEPILTHVEQLLEESIHKARRLSHELSPPVLHHSGLTAALKWLAGQMSEKFGLQVELRTDEEECFDSTSLKVFIFRAVQELLFNIVKHAGVRSARIGLSTADDSLVVTVSDRGHGFDPKALDSASVSAGFGLLSLKERISYFGGHMKIESAPGQGSRFTLIIPCRLTGTHRTPTPPADQQLSLW